MIELAPYNQCTGCSACSSVCPKSCIAMREEKDGSLFPHIDHDICIECHSCQRACPILTPPALSTPIKAYAAWSNDKKERTTSASGGIAYEIYREALKSHYIAVGAAQGSDFKVRLKTADKENEIVPFKNSKYVFSYSESVFPDIKEKLKNGANVVIIALPCQIAAFKKVFHRYEDQLLLVDVVCHGTTPHDFLMQHIRAVENKTGEHAVRMSFRDPDTYTYTYTFTLYNSKGIRFYAQRTKDGDTYQYGYHRNLSYRENCYHCHFAKRERVSDITLNDYKQIGRLAPSRFDSVHNLSSIIVNTQKGQRFVDKMISQNSIDAEERPLEEPLMADTQLQHPSIKKPARFDFEKYINMYDNDFEKAMSKVISKDVRRQKWAKVLSYPGRTYRKIKKIIG